MKKSRQLKDLSLVLAIAFVFGMTAGCGGGGSKQIKLVYTSENVGPFSGGKTGQEIIVNKFRDTRSEKHIAEARTMGGGPFYTVTVEASNDISEWVTNALATELRKAGYNVTRGEGTSNSGKFIINGSLDLLYSPAPTLQGLNADIGITIQIVKNHEIILNSPYNGKGKILPMFMVKPNYVELFDRMLQDLMKRMVPQIITAINQAP